MSIERFSSNGKFHAAIKYNGILYLSGQTSDQCSDCAQQTKEVLSKIEALLEQHGSDKDSILSACIYLQHIADATIFNDIWCEWINGGYEPTRTCVQAEMVRPSILVEVTVVAAVHRT